MIYFFTWLLYGGCVASASSARDQQVVYKLHRHDNNVPAVLMHAYNFFPMLVGLCIYFLNALTEGLQLTIESYIDYVFMPCILKCIYFRIL